MVSWNSNTPHGAEISEALRAQEERFRERFGRDPGPQDPIFFSPDSDEPREQTEEEIRADLDEFLEVLAAHDVPLAPFLAFQELGYIISEMNMHLFSADEVKTFFNAVQRYEDRD